MHGKTEKRTDTLNRRTIQKAHPQALVASFDTERKQFELLHPSIRMQLRLKWNVKVALMRCLLRVNPTQHTYCSHHARLIILSLSSKHRRKREFERWGRAVGGEREMETAKVAKREGEKSGGGSKSGDREITAQRQEAELRGPQGLGSMCRHNERSQTYPASLISTIKANFSAQHAAASSPVCKSPHLSPKIKTSEKER